MRHDRLLIPRSLKRRSRPPEPARNPPDVASALAAMGAEELRSFVRDALGKLDDEPRMQFEDALLRRAATAGSGWRPDAPSQAAVEQAERFAEAARRVGQADPHDVDEHLRQGVKASLAGDHAGARAILGALLPPIADAEIDLGQHELADEVLSVDLHDCAARYLAAVYGMTPLDGRAAAVLDGLEAVQGLAYLSAPIDAMERAVAGPLPDLDRFLSLWIGRLEKEDGPAGDWESDRDRWLREAVARAEGTAGLERLARSTKRPEAARAWCSSVVAQGDWSLALRAYEDSAKLVSSPLWRGDFLDGAALAAHVLGRKDLTKRLAAAWNGSPSLLRLLRYLVADEPAPAALGRRAAAALKEGPKKSPRLEGLLHLVSGDIASAAALLAKAPGLGWSREDHPGGLLFPAFAWLLGRAPRGSVRGEIAAVLQHPLTSDLDLALPFDMGVVTGRVAMKADLPAPSVVDVLRRSSVADELTPKDRAVVLTALKRAATARVRGVLQKKRRRHYDHAAMLVACCVELEARSGKAAPPSAWVEVLRGRTSRYPAFQAALRRALAQATTFKAAEGSLAPETG